MLENVKRVLMVALLLTSFGCAGKFFSPYSSKFQCPDPYLGECTSIPKAYEKVISGYDPPDTQKEAEERKKKEVKKAFYGESDEGVKDVYRRFFLESVMGMLEKPETPLVSPVRVMRMLILPYTDPSGTVYSAPHYVYFIVDTPKFILDVRGLP